MFFLTKPSPERLEQLWTVCRSLPLSYPHPGSTRGSVLRGYAMACHRIRLGSGVGAFSAASQALADLKMLRLGWIEPCGSSRPGQRLGPPAAGALVATLARVFGLWSLNVCRVVYLVDESGSTRRFGFAQATLAGHAEQGEERFLVEWDLANDAVWYELLVHSRPGRLLTWLGYPLVRRLQRRFVQDSLGRVRGSWAS